MYLKGSYRYEEAHFSNSKEFKDRIPPSSLAACWLLNVGYSSAPGVLDQYLGWLLSLCEKSWEFPKGLLLVLSAVDLCLILWSPKEHTSHIILQWAVISEHNCMDPTFYNKVKVKGKRFLKHFSSSSGIAVPIKLSELLLVRDHWVFSGLPHFLSTDK